MMELLKFPEKKSKYSKRPYRCHGCGKIFLWTDDASWYGSYYQLEEKPEELKFYCNDKCCPRGK